MSSINVFPAGDHFGDGSDPGAKQGGGATNFPLLASSSGGAGTAGHMASSALLSVVGTPSKVNLVLIFSEMSIFIIINYTLLFEVVLQHLNKTSNTSPFQEDQWNSALKALPTALSSAVDGTCSPPSKGLSMSTPTAGRYYPESKLALEDGEKPMSEGELDDIEPESEKSNILEVSKPSEQGSGFNGFSSIDSSGNLEDITFSKGLENLQKKVTDMETNGTKESDPDSISELFKGNIDDFILVKSKADKKAEKKARQKAVKAALKAKVAENKAAEGTAEQQKASATAEKLPDADAGKQLPGGSSDRKQAGQKRKNEDDEFDEYKVQKTYVHTSCKEGSDG